MMRVIKICLVLAAMVLITIVVLSTFLPRQIPNLKNEITTYINSSDTVIIDYQDLTFEWVSLDKFSLRPRLNFDQITMRLSQQEEAGLIKFKTAEIEINLVGSLIARSPRFHSIKIDGSKILITNSQLMVFCLTRYRSKNC